MKNSTEFKLFLGLVMIVLALAAVLAYYLAPVPPTLVPPPAETPVAPSSDSGPRNLSLAPGALVTSPLVVTGEAKLWYFEASFPVELLDASGKTIASAPAQALKDWMTEAYVPFRAELAFEQPASKTGTLVFRKDNPSGLPQNDAELRLPVRFR